MSAARLRSGLAVPVAFALVAVTAFVALGSWQLERKAWKEALIASLEQRLSAPPEELPPPARWAGLDRGAAEFRRVKFTARFEPARPALVYAAGSPLRPDVKGPGYFVFAPAQTSDGGVVAVNRGFVPGDRSEAMRHAAPIMPVEVSGALRWPEPGTWFVKDYDPGEDTWFVRDQVAMAARNGWGAVAPFYVEMDAPQPTGGLPRVGSLKVSLRNEHLQYALTWYGLAAVVVVMFTLWLASRRRSAAAA
jgi:cytochrome oxidase assembly protein ShyY1